MSRWNQVNFKESTDKILPNLDEINQSIRRIALDLNNRILTLQNVVESKTNDSQLLMLGNLRNCVQSAASVVSSASTALGVDHVNHSSYGSEFGECFPSEPGETMLRWISSNTIYEFEVQDPAESSSRSKSSPAMRLPIGDSTESEQSDSDTDLEVELVEALMRHGQERYQAKDFGVAERLFRNCLTRLSSDESAVSLHSVPQLKSEVMDHLQDIYLAEEKWDEAHSLLQEKIALGSRKQSSKDDRVLNDMLTLIDVLIHKKSYAEALLYGRRALKSYRKRGSDGRRGVEKSLRTLVRVCNASGNTDEEDAYAAILSEFLRMSPPEPTPENATQPTLQPLGSSDAASKSAANSQENIDTVNHEPAIPGKLDAGISQEDSKAVQGKDDLQITSQMYHIGISQSPSDLSTVTNTVCDTAIKTEASDTAHIAITDILAPQGVREEKPYRTEVQLQSALDFTHMQAVQSKSSEWSTSASDLTTNQMTVSIKIPNPLDPAINQFPSQEPGASRSQYQIQNGARESFPYFPGGLSKSDLTQSRATLLSNPTSSTTISEQLTGPLEADYLSMIDNAFNSLTELDVGPSFKISEAASAVKEEQIQEQAQTQEIVKSAPRSVSPLSDWPGLRRKLVIVGDAATGKTPLLM